MKTSLPLACALGAALLTHTAPIARADHPGITLTPIGTYASGLWNAGGAEIVAHDPDKQRLFVVNAQAASVDVLSIKNPALPTLVTSLVFTAIGGVVNSVAVHDGIIAVAIESVPKTAPGHVVLLDSKFKTLAVLEVGAQPDMITFSKNGRWLLTANEGEPNSYGLTNSVDPEGTVSVIDLSDGADDVQQSDVRTVDFHKFELPMCSTRASAFSVLGLRSRRTSSRNTSRSRKTRRRRGSRCRRTTRSPSLT